MEIARACVEDADALTKIAFAAKRHWDYPESWIRRWQEALTITPDYIIQHSTFIASIGGEVVGFGAVQIQSGEAVLDHLWVLPSFMGRGVGRALFLHAEETARASGAVRMRIVGDPHAERFYSLMGASLYGREPASMDGEERFLPLLEKTLSTPNSLVSGLKCDLSISLVVQMMVVSRAFSRIHRFDFGRYRDACGLLQNGLENDFISRAGA